MKSIYVKDISKGEMIMGETFVVFEKKQATDKNNNPYYDLVLGDKTGQIKGKIWNDAIPNVETSSLKIGRVVMVDARVDEFRGQSQLTILKLVGIDEEKLDDYLESSQFDADEMMEELKSVAAALKSVPLQQLFSNLFSDEEVIRKLKYWPAASTIHHDFRSGLLQHLLEMLATAAGLEKFYPDTNFDIVRAGIIVHDIGKLKELDLKGVVPTYTKEGSLIGHMALGLELLEQYYPDDFPESIKMHLKHIILSHHGTREFGSPVLPATVEAIMVHHIDSLSAKARTVDKGLREDLDDDGMTGYNRWLGTRLWSGE